MSHSLSAFAAGAAKEYLGKGLQIGSYKEFANYFNNRNYSIPDLGHIEEAFELINTPDAARFKNLMKAEYICVPIIGAVVTASVSSKYGDIKADAAKDELLAITLGLTQNAWMHDRARIMASVINSVATFSLDKEFTEVFANDLFNTMADYCLEAKKVGKDPVIYLKGIYTPEIKNEKEINFDPYIWLAGRHKQSRPEIADILKTAKRAADNDHGFQP